MSRPRNSTLVIAVLASLWAGATCGKEREAPPGSSKPTLPDSGGALVAAAPSGRTSAAGVGDALVSVPGMDFSSLPAPLQKELVSVLTDDFCSCGCPHTLLACLKTHPSCKHAKRTTQLAAAAVREGTSASDILLMLSKYASSFRAPRAPLKVDSRQCMGPADSKVTLVAFSDFECPYCRAARPLFEEFSKKANVKFCFAPFPLPGHANAMRAGQAALFARDAGKFWKVHDQVFEDQMSLSPEKIRQIVVGAGLNGAEFDKVVAGAKYIDELNVSKGMGKQAGVDATPSLFINGRKFTLPITMDALQFALDDEREWMANNGAWAQD